MTPLALLRSAFAVFRRSQWEAEMEEEMRSHIRNRTDDLERSGLSQAQAERRAFVEFGRYEHFKEECRESAGAHFMDTLIQDIALAGRLLRKSPGFATITILTLALGVGATTALFSVINAVLLRPLPFSHPDQLIAMSETNQEAGITTVGCSYLDLEELQRSGAFAGIAGVGRHALTLTGSGDPAEVATVVVMPEIFSLLNVSPLAGRYLFAEDGRKGAAPVVLVSESLWRARFDRSPDLLGSSIMLDQRPFTVVGIMPAGFQIPVFGGRQEIWIPIAQDPLFSTFMPKRDVRGFFVVGRLTAGVTLARGQAEADSLSAALANEFPADSGFVLRLAPLQETIFGAIRTQLLVLLCSVGLVLLLACVNIANLLLARATARAREMALRQALGAGRLRLIRQLLTESALLALAGSSLGLAVAWVSARALALLLPRGLPLMRSVQLDWWVLGFAVLLSVGAIVIFGLVPALLTTDSNMQSKLKDSGTRSGGGRSRVGPFLAAAEIGLATVLVVSAGLLMRSLLSMTSVNPGFNPAHILKAEISLPRYRYPMPQQWTTFSNELLDRVQAQPAMQDSAIAVPVPLADNFVNLPFAIADHAPLPPGTPSTAHYVSVSQGYFQVMGIPLVRGRYFNRDDSGPAHPVAIISDAFGRFYFKDEDPVGKRLVFGFPPDSNVTREIVGVIGDVRDAALTQDPAPMMYVPFSQAPFWGAVLVVKSTSPPATLVGAIREAVRSLDSDLPITDIVTMPEALDASVTQPKLHTWLLGGFGVVALMLASVGVFGVVSYSVASRTRELGVRAALGASHGSIGRMILKQGLVLGGIGLGLGLAGALGFARLLRSELYGVSAYDPTTLVVSIVVLLGVAIAACYIPARRAMRVDPMIALRCE